MLQLHEDILRNILELLDLNELFIMARVCRIFRYLVRRILFKRYGRWFYTFNLSAFQVYEFKIIMNLIAWRLPQLNIYCSPMYNENEYLKVCTFHQMENLIKLKSMAQNLSDKHVQKFARNCVQLKHFKVTGMPANITGNYIWNMRVLKNLTLESCTLTKRNLKLILERLRLEFLQILYNQIEYEDINDQLSVTTCPSLRSLSILVNLRKMPMILRCQPQLELLKIYYTNDELGQWRNFRRLMDAAMPRRRIPEIANKLKTISINARLEDFRKSDTSFPVVSRDQAGFGVLNKIVYWIRACKNLEKVELPGSSYYVLLELVEITKELKIQNRKLKLNFTSLCKHIVIWTTGSCEYTSQSGLSIKFKFVRSTNLIQYEFLSDEEYALKVSKLKHIGS